MENIREKLIETGKLKGKLSKIRDIGNNGYLGNYDGENFLIKVYLMGEIIYARNYLDELVDAMNQVSNENSSKKPCAVYNLMSGEFAVEFEKYPRLRYKALKRREKEKKIRNLRELVLS